MSTDLIPPTEDVLRRIRGEYTEMPGLRVTPQQAQRLWALDAATVLRALDSLVEAGFLRRSGEHYMRLTQGPAVSSSLRMARAAIPSTRAPRHAVL
jgi:hypothetical protein